MPSPMYALQHLLVIGQADWAYPAQGSFHELVGNPVFEAAGRGGGRSRDARTVFPDGDVRFLTANLPSSARCPRDQVRPSPSITRDDPLVFVVKPDDGRIGVGPPR